MRVALLLLVVGACGRFGFTDHAATDIDSDVDGDVDGATDGDGALLVDAGIAGDVITPDSRRRSATRALF